MPGGEADTASLLTAGLVSRFELEEEAKICRRRCGVVAVLPPRGGLRSVGPRPETLRSSVKTVSLKSDKDFKILGEFLRVGLGGRKFFHTLHDERKSRRPLRRKSTSSVTVRPGEVVLFFQEPGLSESGNRENLSSMFAQKMHLTKRCSPLLGGIGLTIDASMGLVLMAVCMTGSLKDPQ